jgi:hypothetical protein
MGSPLFVARKVGLQIIWEENYFQEAENNDQFDQDDGPQHPACTHGAEALTVKRKNF